LLPLLLRPLLFRLQSAGLSVCGFLKPEAHLSFASLLVAARVHVWFIEISIIAREMNFRGNIAKRRA